MRVKELVHARVSFVETRGCFDGAIRSNSPEC